MTIEEMKKRKQELGYSLDDIAALSGLPKGTVSKVFGGATKSPRKGTIRALEKVLLPREKVQNDNASESYVLHETAPAYRAVPKRYTTDDYYRLPGDERYELIDGVLYNLAAPSFIHQRILGELFLRFHQCIQNSGKPCEAAFAPCDVRLDSDQYTMVQPDLFIICDRDQVKDTYLEGAPALIVEIISESTRSRDSVLKLNKYKKAGVREYWIVDPLNQAILVYLFGDKSTVDTYAFSDKVPIGISEGQCFIDFSEIDTAVGLSER